MPARRAPARLHRRADIRATFEDGRVLHGAVMVLHVRAGDPESSPRATVVAGRKVGGAVARNRAKRRLRAALRLEGVPSGFDVIVVARATALTRSFEELRRDLRDLLGRVVAGGPR